jgi:hypothetical protein
MQVLGSETHLHGVWKGAGNCAFFVIAQSFAIKMTVLVSALMPA